MEKIEGILVQKKRLLARCSMQVAYPPHAEPAPHGRIDITGNSYTHPSFAAQIKSIRWKSNNLDIESEYYGLE